MIPDLEEHLDELAAAGGNVVRNTMSSRLDNGYEIYRFHQDHDGTFDLEKWNPEYWLRFTNLLDHALARDIIVQIEVWDRFDYSQEHWDLNPWNPAKNWNYTHEETGFAPSYPQPAWKDAHPFFFTVPGTRHYRTNFDVVRGFQERFVDKMLSISLAYPNVLYCVDNETSTDPRWGQYWMQRIVAKAEESQVDVYVTDMFDDVYLARRSAYVRRAIRNSAYTFMDISQVNSRVFGQLHWNRLRWLIRKASRRPVPVNHIKIYSDGETSFGSGTPADGVERFWRNLIAGSATCRFHRPGAGIGLNKLAKACIRAARIVETRVRFWEVESHMELLLRRRPNQAYLAADPGRRYILFLTNGGEVTLDMSSAVGQFSLYWIDVTNGVEKEAKVVAGGAPVGLVAPGNGPWVATIVE